MNPYDILRMDLRSLIKDWRDDARTVMDDGAATVLNSCADNIEEVLYDHE